MLSRHIPAEGYFCSILISNIFLFTSLSLSKTSDFTFYEPYFQTLFFINVSIFILVSEKPFCFEITFILWSFQSFGSFPVPSFFPNRRPLHEHRTHPFFNFIVFRLGFYLYIGTTLSVEIRFLPVHWTHPFFVYIIACKFGYFNM